MDQDAALDRFLTHAPYLIEATRRGDGKPLAVPETGVLIPFEILLARVQADVGARDNGEPGGMNEAMALWLESGEDLVDVVRATTVGPAEEPSRPAVATATPPKPPTAVAAPGRTR
ncbi:hypothetical protein NKH18_48120 [Streptomyces sp. M10(2022)]